MNLKKLIGLWLNEISFDDYYSFKNDFNNLVFKSNIFFCYASHINSIPDNLKLKRLDIFDYNGELLKNKITIDKLSIWDLSFNIVSSDRINFTDDFKFNELYEIILY